MSQSQENGATALDALAATLPDLHIGNVAPLVSKKLSVPGCIVILSNADGTIGMTADGVNHFRANEMLSVGIHINLSQHDDLVRAGAAGSEAQERQQDLDAKAVDVASSVEGAAC